MAFAINDPPQVLILLSAVNDWGIALNCHQSVHCLFLDLSKAFGSVPHERLLLKLQLFGVGGSLLLWFRNYLTIPADSELY